MTEIERMAMQWAAARARIVELSIYPIGNADYAAALRDLGDAEDNLSRAVKEIKLSLSTSRQAMQDRMEERMQGQIVTANELASELGVTSRTIYRYVEMMRARGIEIESEPGYGYSIRERKSRKRSENVQRPEGNDNLEVSAHA